MTDLLLQKCTEKFNIMLRICKAHKDCPAVLPKSLFIRYVKAKYDGKAYKPVKTLGSWRYENGMIAEVPADAKPVTAPLEQGLFTESYAEFGYSRFRKKAFVSIYCGENIAMGFEYDMSVGKGSFSIDNEKVLWD